MTVLRFLADWFAVAVAMWAALLAVGLISRLWADRKRRRFVRRFDALPRREHPRHLHVIVNDREYCPDDADTDDAVSRLRHPARAPWSVS